MKPLKLIYAVFLIGLCSACENQRGTSPAPYGATSQNVSSTKPVAGADGSALPAARPSGIRVRLLNLQADYLRDEGVQHRGPRFTKLFNTIRAVLAFKPSPPLTELEILELLGPPDYGISDKRGASYIYVANYAFLVDVGPTGLVTHVGSTSIQDADLQNAPRWRRYGARPATTQGAGYLGLKIAVDRGASPLGLRLLGVFPGSPAKNAGLKEGDIIVRMNGEPAGTDPAEFAQKISSLTPGKVVSLSYYPGGSPPAKSVDIHLVKLPEVVGEE